MKNNAAKVELKNEKSFFVEKREEDRQNKKENYPQKVGKMCVICELCKLHRVCGKRRRKFFQKITLFTHKG